ATHARAYASAPNEQSYPRFDRRRLPSYLPREGKPSDEPPASSTRSLSDGVDRECRKHATLHAENCKPLSSHCWDCQRHMFLRCSWSSPIWPASSSRAPFRGDPAVSQRVAVSNWRGRPLPAWTWRLVL